MGYTVESTPLGKDTAYPDHYDPSILCPIAREAGRLAVGLSGNDDLPFKGVDYWNAYEVSWLNQKGKPEIGLLVLTVPAESEFIVESKSLKLYLNSLNQHRFESRQKVSSTITADLSQVLGCSVGVDLYSAEESEDHFSICRIDGECIDDLDIEVSDFDVDKSILKSDQDNENVSETLVSHLLRSNCPVTSQPDWASVIVRYHGPKIDREALLQYLISYRTHNEFHEQCVERIFVDVLGQCKPSKLSVYARYTRRGGIDINPFRSNYEAPSANLRALRQ